MGKITIEESGAIFGPFNEADLFHIEKSEILRKLGDKIKTVEFVVVRNDNQALVFVEAKSKCPNAANRPLQFVLVLTNPEIDISWLSGPKAELEKRLLSIRKTWDLEVIVMNRELAETYHLITKQE